MRGFEEYRPRNDYNLGSGRCMCGSILRGICVHFERSPYIANANAGSSDRERS